MLDHKSETHKICLQLTSGFLGQDTCVPEAGVGWATLPKEKTPTPCSHAAVRAATSCDTVAILYWSTRAPRTSSTMCPHCFFYLGSCTLASHPWNIGDASQSLWMMQPKLTAELCLYQVILRRKLQLVQFSRVLLPALSSSSTSWGLPVAVHKVLTIMVPLLAV